MTEDSKNAIAQTTTLNRSLGILVNNYPIADVIEQLASIAFENKLSKTAEVLDSAVDVALEESKQ